MHSQLLNYLVFIKHKHQTKYKFLTFTAFYIYKTKTILQIEFTKFKLQLFYECIIVGDVVLLTLNCILR